jgi:DNA-binding MarR family transcriptional regulator
MGVNPVARFWLAGGAQIAENDTETKRTGRLLLFGGDMPFAMRTEQALRLWHDVSLALVRNAGPDLTTRQATILLTIYLEAPPHTVRGLASKLGVTKPVITRALDTMSRMGLVARRRDENDRRNVVVQRTVDGALFLQDLADRITAVAAEL